MPEQFYKMTFGHYQLYAEGYSIRQAREWERTRYLATAVLNSQGAKISPIELFRLKTDSDSEKRPLTKDEALEALKFFDTVKWQA